MSEDIDKILMVKFHRTSMVTGKEHTREIGVSIRQLIAWGDGALIQDAFPQLTDDEREFIKTGITPEEWAEAFPDDDEDEDDADYAASMRHAD
jgi:hypothetical protein